MECELDNADMQGTPSFKWINLLDLRTNRSVKWNVKYLDHNFRICGCAALLLFQALFQVL